MVVETIRDQEQLGNLSHFIPESQEKTEARNVPQTSLDAGIRFRMLFRALCS
jgi:hypothetical protein